jgi:hypothetical protein
MLRAFTGSREVAAGPIGEASRHHSPYDNRIEDKQSPNPPPVGSLILLAQVIRI